MTIQRSLAIEILLLSQLTCHAAVLGISHSWEHWDKPTACGKNWLKSHKLIKKKPKKPTPVQSSVPLIALTKLAAWS